ncbi:hypothetical protein FOCC_FOCC003911 [Frankliniella occidentalis]|nr:hypothetical protein FOCC_FOCC003911 [Frankliniella occidentalis]
MADPAARRQCSRRDEGIAEAQRDWPRKVATRVKSTSVEL